MARTRGEIVAELENERVEKERLLRDTFAAAALQGLVEGDYCDGPEPETGRPAEYAHRAYQIADAMLAERGTIRGRRKARRGRRKTTGILLG